MSRQFAVLLLFISIFASACKGLDHSSVAKDSEPSNSGLFQGNDAKRIMKILVTAGVHGAPQGPAGGSDSSGLVATNVVCSSSLLSNFVSCSLNGNLATSGQDAIDLRSFMVKAGAQAETNGPDGGSDSSTLSASKIACSSSLISNSVSCTIAIGAGTGATPGSGSFEGADAKKIMKILVTAGVHGAPLGPTGGSDSSGLAATNVVCSSSLLSNFVSCSLNGNLTLSGQDAIDLRTFLVKAGAHAQSNGPDGGSDSSTLSASKIACQTSLLSNIAGCTISTGANAVPQ